MKVKQFSRTALFRIALEAARDQGREPATVDAFAGHLGVSRQHLYSVLSGLRESPRIIEETDRFVEEHLSRLFDFIASRYELAA